MDSDAPSRAGLIERLEAASVGSREFDADIQDALFDCQIKRERQILQPYVFHLGDGEWEVIPAYTTSIDAALALKDRVLPGQAAALGDMAFEDAHQKPWACIWTKGGSPDFHGYGQTPALALCIATLKAYETLARDGSGTQGSTRVIATVTYAPTPPTTEHGEG